VKEKLLAAKRAGVQCVVLPEGNRQDVVDMAPKLRRGLRFVFVRTMDEVLAVALVPQGNLLALSPAGRGPEVKVATLPAPTQWR